MTTATRTSIDELAAALPQELRDVKLNLKGLANSDHLDPVQIWGVALACAYNEGYEPLIEAIREAASAAGLDEATLADAKAVAGLMSMNNVYYRFRHFMDKEPYQSMPARLRMTRIGRPGGDKLNFELMSLAVSAVNGCSLCVRSHENILVQGGITEAAIHDAVRIAAVVRSAAVSLRIA